MKTHCLEVSGDFACFTRPEMKVERVSYDVITPSAARAIFDAILWKPAIRWINLRRNEVGSMISARNVKTAIRSFPRFCVGMHTVLGSGSVWVPTRERGNQGKRTQVPATPPPLVPTLLRGNAYCAWKWLRMGSHAGAWEPEIIHN